ncbi:hypothetical protein [Reyranella sp.]|uniref:hypothetical protein n=1 Tax=Reyranella sp. TaxID=1929291 RepID=UPI002721B6CA|nr:hypothetical protein [Reyranella sp.]MDO8974560.1 hypothetical protein [Reyranella sp.]
MKTISRSYDSYAQARAAVDAIERAGIPSSDVSLIANKHVGVEYENVEAVPETATGAGIGAVVGGGVGLLAGLGLLAIPGFGPVVAAGWLAAMAVGTAAGVATGGLMGALIGAGIDEEEAAILSESVRRGGTLLTVRAPDGEVGRIEGLLSIHRPTDIAAHAARWRDEVMGKQACGASTGCPRRGPVC